MQIKKDTSKFNKTEVTVLICITTLKTVMSLSSNVS